jgi:hypothetical protein
MNMKYLKIIIVLMIFASFGLIESCIISCGPVRFITSAVKLE